MSGYPKNEIARFESRIFEIRKHRPVGYRGRSRRRAREVQIINRSATEGEAEGEPEKGPFSVPAWYYFCWTPVSCLLFQCFLYPGSLLQLSTSTSGERSSPLHLYSRPLLEGEPSGTYWWDFLSVRPCVRASVHGLFLV